MEKKRTLLLVVSLFLLVFLIPFISAAMSLKITGEVNSQTSDLWLRIDSNAAGGLDVYDMQVQSAPSNYSQFSSAVAGNSLSIDSWSTNPRTINLTYNMNPSQTGTLNLSWDNTTISSDYVVTLKYYGDDSDYQTQVGDDVNMRTSNSYSNDIDSESDIYIQIGVSDYVAPAVATPSSGGEGGGAGITRSLDSIEIIDPADKKMSVYLKLDEVSKRTIKLHNPNIVDSISVTLIGQELKYGKIEILDFVDEQTFTLGPGETQVINVRFISPGTTGIYKGKIIVNRQEILVTVYVNEEEILFDAKVDIFNKVVNPGDELKYQVILENMQEIYGMDVNLQYTIKTWDGKPTGMEKSETIFVEGSKTLTREFLIKENAKAGEYYLNLKMSYPWPDVKGVAIASDDFEIAEVGLPAVFGYKWLLLFLIGIFILLFAIILITKKRKKRKRKKR